MKSSSRSRQVLAARATRLVAAAAILTTAATLAACGTPAPVKGGGDDTGGIKVMASFYPLQWLTQQIAGTELTITSLTPKGAEPHDSELELSSVTALGDADLLVTLSGFQSAVDEAAQSNPPKTILDAAPLVDLEDGDPHFWLDPTRMVTLTQPIADALAKADPAHADGYRERAQAATEALQNLDQDLQAGLEPFRGATMVTTHAAFRYFAERYGLQQISVSGIDPEAEASPARITQVRDQIKDLTVKTIYFEDQASPKTAETLARDLGMTTSMLNPVETDAGG
ncbi:MAG: metal ABC transporter substrate-binding protein, partial [Bifidobacteriaceae bacterium]|nr:metal ABC transporter substrate-binding protein [Bifidobacteriaceae bacterium]